MQKLIRDGWGMVRLSYYRSSNKRLACALGGCTNIQKKGEKVEREMDGKCQKRERGSWWTRPSFAPTLEVGGFKGLGGWGGTSLESMWYLPTAEPGSGGCHMHGGV